MADSGFKTNQTGQFKMADSGFKTNQTGQFKMAGSGFKTNQTGQFKMADSGFKMDQEARTVQVPFPSNAEVRKQERRGNGGRKGGFSRR